MSARAPLFVRIGAVLALFAALLAFLTRAAMAQQPAAPQRLSLGDAARMAAQRAASVLSAQTRVDQAQARVTQARAALLPNVGGDVNFSQRTVNSATFGFNFPTPAGQPPILNPNGQIIGPVKIMDYRARGSEPLFDYSAIQRVRGSELAVTAAGADVATIAEQAATGATAAYLTSLRSDAELGARVADSVLADELLGIARDELAAGVGVALDVTRAQSQLVGVRAQLIAARGDRDRARLNVLRALDLPLEVPVELTDSLATMPMSDTVNESAAVALALGNRPDIRSLDQQIAAANQQVAAIKAERFPTVGVSGDDGLIGNSAQHLLTTYDAVLDFSMPFFDGRRRSARIEEQQAAVKDLEIRRRDLQQQVAVDVRGAILDLTSARQQVDAARERLRLADQELTQARERFRAGVAGNADVITAELSLDAARNGVIDALTSYQSARVSLARAEGTVTQLR